MEFRQGVETAITGVADYKEGLFKRYTQFLDYEQAKQLSLLLGDTLWFELPTQLYYLTTISNEIILGSYPSIYCCITS